MNQTTTLDFLYSRWGWTAVWLGIAGLSILFWLFTVAVGWHPWAEVASARAAGYAKEQCEFVNARAFFVQTANFWSNFAYLACGLFIWLRNRTFLGVAVGVTMCLIWFGSGLFHASLTEFGQLLDVVSIYVALGALLLYAVIQVIFDGGKFDPYRPGPGVYAALAVVMLFTAFALLKNTGICAELALLPGDLRFRSFCTCLRFPAFRIGGVGCAQKSGARPNIQLARDSCACRLGSCGPLQICRRQWKVSVRKRERPYLWATFLDPGTRPVARLLGNRNVARVRVLHDLDT